MIYAGTTIVAGTAAAVVTAASSRSEMRRALAMAPRKLQEVGLQRQLRHITGRALPFSFASGGLVGLISLMRGTLLRDAVWSHWSSRPFRRGCRWWPPWRSCPLPAASPTDRS
nr:hypothetical protein [Mycobacterium genavense]